MTNQFQRRAVQTNRRAIEVVPLGGLAEHAFQSSRFSRIEFYRPVLPGRYLIPEPAANLGIIFLMLGFGASFGYTVMSRISLLIGRFQYLLGPWLGIIE